MSDSTASPISWRTSSPLGQMSLSLVSPCSGSLSRSTSIRPASA